MKKETIKKLMTLPKDSQEKLWKLAIERLKAEKKLKNSALSTQCKNKKGDSDL